MSSNITVSNINPEISVHSMGNSKKLGFIQSQNYYYFEWETNRKIIKRVGTWAKT